MNTNKWNWTILLGVLSFLLNFILLVFGRLEAPLSYFLIVAGISLIGFGVSGNRRVA